MSAAVYRALADDAPLQTLLQTNQKAIWPDYTAKSVPRKGPFVILRWGPQQFVGAVRRGPRILTVWAHQPLDTTGSDYTRIELILDRIRNILEGMEQVEGSDGVVVTHASFTGQSGNLTDPGFNTITMNSAFRVLLRMVA